MRADPKSKLKAYLWIGLSAWTAVLAVSFGWNHSHHHDGIDSMAKVQAISEWRKDVLYRRWNAMNGPVYARASESMPPNPYLAHLPERDIQSPKGFKLTLVNPAYMTRQVHELGAKDGVYGHITSLNPVRPDNAADEWEKKALAALALGSSEYMEVVGQQDGEYLRMMRPLLTEEACLKCHEKQGYVVGDLRGGIGVKIPLAPIIGAGSATYRFLVATHLILWAVGSLIMLFASKMLSREIDIRIAAEEKAREVERAMSEDARLKSLGTLAGGIAHNFNNLLAVIKGNAQLQIDDLKALKAGTESCDEIVEATERACALIDKMGELADKRGRAAAPVADIASSVEEALSRCDTEGVMVEFDRPKAAEAEIPGRDLREVLGVLISNACDSYRGLADAERVVRIKVAAERRAYDSFSDPGWEGWLIQVGDQGIGMPPETVKRVFEPFFTTKDVGMGDGLGLPLAKALVGRWDGEITVTSSLGVGTTVSVWLPKALKEQD